MLPVLIATSPQNLSDLVAHNSGFIMIISNIVVGVGFLGGGIIVKSGEGHVHGLTTAAVVWVTAAIGILSGMGLLKLAATAAVIITSLLYISRKLGMFKQVRPDGK
jgi:putative Mg2+ transporter-C (MgtC) family protein